MSSSLVGNDLLPGEHTATATDLQLTAADMLFASFSATMADRDSTSKDRYVIKMWDINSIAENKCLYTKADHKNEITALEFSPCGGLLASASEDGHLCVWDAEVSCACYLVEVGDGANMWWTSDWSVEAEVQG